MVTTIAIEDYRLEWAEQGAREAAPIKLRLKRNIKHIEHFGGTSIPGVASRPILDLMVDVEREALIDACSEPLLGIGYHRRANVPGSRALAIFRHPGDVTDHRLAVELWFFVVDSMAWFDNQLFRDTLRMRPPLASAYGSLKQSIAALHPDNPDAYRLAKDRFIASVLEDARYRR